MDDKSLSFEEAFGQFVEATMYTDFKSLSFPKKGSDIKAKAETKRKGNVAKIDEKKAELQKMCKEFDLDIFKLLTDFDTFTGVSLGMPSQEMEKLRVLAQRIDVLEKENKTLSLIVGNLPDNTEFNLSFDELRYFGF